MGVAIPHVMAIINALRFAGNALVLCLLASGRPSAGSFFCALLSVFCFSRFGARILMFFWVSHCCFLISNADFSEMGSPGSSFYFLDCPLWCVLLFCGFLPPTWLRVHYFFSRSRPRILYGFVDEHMNCHGGLFFCLSYLCRCSLLAGHLGRFCAIAIDFGHLGGSVGYYG